MKFDISLSETGTKMNTIFRKYWKTALFTLLGAVLGFAYWRIIGCSSGTCPLTSNWHTTVLFGGIIGYLAVPAKNKSVPGEGENPVQETEKADDGWKAENS